MKILNLTQHAATPEQIALGVEEPDAGTKARIRELLTFEELRYVNFAELNYRAAKLTGFAIHGGYEAAMIGGAPFLMAPLERVLIKCGIRPLYAFSKRESVEEAGPDGVRKTTVFRHLGFYDAQAGFPLRDEGVMRVNEEEAERTDENICPLRTFLVLLRDEVRSYPGGEEKYSVFEEGLYNLLLDPNTEKGGLLCKQGVWYIILPGGISCHESAAYAAENLMTDEPAEFAGSLIRGE